MIIIMWARVCIVLHNFIIQIEGDNLDGRWRECLVRRGLDRECGTDEDSSDEDEPGDGDALGQVQQRLETPGQCFRLKVMGDLFNSPFCVAERHP